MATVSHIFLIHSRVGDVSLNYCIIDRTSLVEKSARKDEKTLFWPSPISLVWLPVPNQRAGNKTAQK